MNPANDMPRFTSILAARASNARPSDLEVHLRQHCTKLVVQPKLLGAHLVFPTESLAVRAYYPIDVDRLDGEWKNQVGDTVPVAMKSIHEGSEQDQDGLRAFDASFRLSLVLFVLPPETFQDQMDRIDSFVNRSMRLLELESSTRVLFVNTTEHAIATITTVAESLTPAKSQLKKAYFERQMNQDIRLHVTAALRKIVADLGGQRHDAEVLIKGFPTLHSLIEADSSKLQSLPLTDSTREGLMWFFHSTDETLAEQFGGDELAPPAHPPESMQDLSTIQAAASEGPMEFNREFPEPFEELDDVTVEESAMPVIVPPLFVPTSSGWQHSGPQAAAGVPYNASYGMYYPPPLVMPGPYAPMMPGTHGQSIPPRPPNTAGHPQPYSIPFPNANYGPTYPVAPSYTPGPVYQHAVRFHPGMMGNYQHPQSRNAPHYAAAPPPPPRRHR